MITQLRQLRLAALRAHAPLVILFSLTASAGAGEQILAATYYLYPNLPAQNITFSVSGGQNIQGVDLFAQIADGGPAVGGAIVGPSIVGSINNPGLIFANNNTGIIDGNPGNMYGNQLVILSTTTEAGTIVGAGPLATLTVDTEGFPSGTFALNLSGTVAGDSDLGAKRCRRHQRVDHYSKRARHHTGRRKHRRRGERPGHKPGRQSLASDGNERSWRHERRRRRQWAGHFRRLRALAA